MLTEQQNMARLLYSIHYTSGVGDTYCDLYDQIHIDKKWFFLHKVKKSVYLAPDEILPYHSTKNGLHIIKVMFLAAVA
jgi:hypothetical protein